MSASRLFENMVVEPNHCNAMFNPLGMLNTYSGVQISRPSAWLINFLKRTTAGGVLLSVNAVLKCGKMERSSQICHSKSLEKMPWRYLINCRLEEFSLALPLMARMCFRGAIRADQISNC